ncbi:MAG: helix-turn-helix transcriptional regulator [Pseudomonadota bacterium]
MELKLKDVKARIRRHRTMSNTSISELAEIGGVSPSTIRRYDDPSDPREPSLFVMAKICAHYGLSLDWLVFGSTSNIDEEVRFRMMLENLSTHLPVETQIAFTDFMQGIYDYVLQLGRDGAPLVELQTKD